MIPFSPSELGLPPKIEDWRPQQHQAVDLYFSTTVKYVAEAIPTGGGKSGISLAVASLNGGRTCILTSTNGLLDQYTEEGRGTGLVQIRGRANYQCGEQSGRTCEDGAKYRCSAAHSDNCPYWHGYQTAKQAKIVVTNYAYFTAIHKYGDGLGHQFDTLVLDEAHAAPDEVCRASALEFTTGDVYHTLDFRWPDHQYLESLASWTSWAKSALDIATKKLAAFEAVAIRGGRGSLLKQEIQEYDNLKNLKARLHNLVTRRGDWQTEPMRGGHRFEPLWAHEHAEDYLFRYGRRILLLSATVIPKTLAMLGIPAGTDCVYREFPATFDPRRSPIYLLPSVNLNYNSPPEDIATWLGRCDAIIQSRLDRKGIVMAHSHDRAWKIATESRYAEHMISNSDRESVGPPLPTLLEQFRDADPPCIFTSASLTTGYDFPGDQCEYIIIGKMPFPNTQGRVVKARAEVDKDYRDYVASQSLIQSCGRGMRYPEDRCEMFAIDNLVGISIWRKKQFYPEWFRKQVRRVQEMPRCPAKMK